VPPPPLPVPAIASHEGGAPAAAAPRPRWGSAAAGIAAFAGLATLVVVGAARRDVVTGADVWRSRTSTAAPAAVSASALPRENAAAPPRAAASLPTGAWPSAVASSSAASTPSSLPSASELLGVRWEPLPSGGTRVVVALDGALGADRVRASHIAGD